MQRVSPLLEQFWRSNDLDEFSPDNLLLLCRRNNELLRTVWNELERAFRRRETAALFKKYRQLFNRYNLLVQGVSLVSLFAKMYVELVTPARTMQVIWIHLEECYRYCQARAQKMETRLKEAVDVLNDIDASAESGTKKELGTLVLTFDEKLRIAALDAKESVEKVKETYSTISEQLGVPGGHGSKWYFPIAMGLVCGATFGGLSSWFLDLRYYTIPFLVGASTVGVLIASYYNSLESGSKTIKSRFSQHRQRHEYTVRKLDNLSCGIFNIVQKGAQTNWLLNMLHL